MTLKQNCPLALTFAVVKLAFHGPYSKVIQLNSNSILPLLVLLKRYKLLLCIILGFINFFDGSTVKRLARGRGRVNLTLLLVKTCFFVAFNIIISLIFLKNFIEIPQVVQKIWRISPSILVIFVDFHWFFGFFDISLIQRN